MDVLSSGQNINILNYQPSTKNYGLIIWILKMIDQIQEFFYNLFGSINFM